MPYGEVVSDRYRTLLLLRHAKSDYPAGVADHDRPLAARGVRPTPARLLACTA